MPKGKHMYLHLILCILIGCYIKISMRQHDRGAPRWIDELMSQNLFLVQASLNLRSGYVPGNLIVH